MVAYIKCNKIFSPDDQRSMIDTRCVCVCVSAVGGVVVAVPVCVCLRVCVRLDHETSTFSRALRRMLCSSDAEVVLY